MTTTTEPLAAWEHDLPIDPLGPERRAEMDRRAAVITAHIAAMPPVPGRWERSALHAAALEAVRYPDPAAVLGAVHWSHGSLAETQTLSGYGIACREAVAALAAGQGQQADTGTVGAWLEARIGDAVRRTS